MIGRESNIFIRDKLMYTLKWFQDSSTLLKTEEVEIGDDGNPPQLLNTDLIFLGWDKNYTDVQSNLDIYAKTCNMLIGTDNPDNRPNYTEVMYDDAYLDIYYNKKYNVFYLVKFSAPECKLSIYVFDPKLKQYGWRILWDKDVVKYYYDEENGEFYLLRYNSKKNPSNPDSEIQTMYQMDKLYIIKPSSSAFNTFNGRDCYFGSNYIIDMDPTKGSGTHYNLNCKFTRNENGKLYMILMGIFIENNKRVYKANIYQVNYEGCTLLNTIPLSSYYGPDRYNSQYNFFSIRNYLILIGNVKSMNSASFNIVFDINTNNFSLQETTILDDIDSGVIIIQNPYNSDEVLVTSSYLTTNKNDVNYRYLHPRLLGLSGNTLIITQQLDFNITTISDVKKVFKTLSTRYDYFLLGDAILAQVNKPNGTSMSNLTVNRYYNLEEEFNKITNYSKGGYYVNTYEFNGKLYATLDPYDSNLKQIFTYFILP